MNTIAMVICHTEVCICTREKHAPILEGREPLLTLRQEKQYLHFGHLFPWVPGPFSCTKQALYYKNLGLHDGLASGTRPL